MELDRQTILVLFSVILGLTLFGGIYLSSDPPRSQERPAYAPEDIRYKFQQEAAKEAKKKKPGPEPIISSESDEAGGEDANEAPSEDNTAEEPEIE